MCAGCEVVVFAGYRPGGGKYMFGTVFIVVAKTGPAELLEHKDSMKSMLFWDTQLVLLGSRLIT